MFKLFLIFPLLILSELLHAQVNQDMIYVGDTESKAIRIMKETAAKDSELSYQTKKEWDQQANGYATQHAVFTGDLQIIAAVCFNGKVLYLITGFPQLSGSNVEDATLEKFKSKMRSQKGIELGFNYLGDDIYEYKVVSPSSYTSIITASLRNKGRITMFLNTYNTGSLKVLKERMVSDLKSKYNTVSVSFL